MDLARNKYPEETVEKIIQTATKLFLEKGYENTSIQDIINQLGGLSKGAIYHHFHSKDDILDGVMESIYNGKESQMDKIRNDKRLNGLQKLQRFMAASVLDGAQQKAFSLGLDMLQNSRILAMQIRDTVEEVARRMIYPVVQEAIADGSMAGILFPEEFTETFLLLANVWLNPMVYAAQPEQIECKCRFLQHFVRSVGITEPLITEEMIARLKECTTLYNESRERKENVQSAANEP